MSTLGATAVSLTKTEPRALIGIIEASVAALLVAWVLWTPHHTAARQKIVWLAVGFIAASLLYSIYELRKYRAGLGLSQTLEYFGLYIKDWTGSKELLIWTIEACALMLVLSWLFDTLHAHVNKAKLVAYITMVPVQETLLHWHFTPLHRRFYAGCPDKTSRHNGIMFGLLHLPNPILCLATWFYGKKITNFYSQHRNIYAACVSHIMLGITFACVIPEMWSLRMSVGIECLNKIRAFL